MSGRVKIKSKDKDKKPKIDVFKIIENRFKNMNELRDLIDMDPKKGLVRIRDGAGFREVERGGCLHRNYLNLLEEELGAKLSIDLNSSSISSYILWISLSRITVLSLTYIFSTSSSQKKILSL